MHYFHESGFNFWAIDANEKHIENLQKKYPKLIASFKAAPLEKIPFSENTFNHIICNAVLHFAKNETHFKQMFAELVRMLKKEGSLFIRMTSDIDVEGKAKLLHDGVYFLPDETERFLLTRSSLNELMEIHQFSFLELVKSTNVNDLRSMTTLVLIK